MPKDLLTTIIGFVTAASLAASEYVAAQVTGEYGLQFWVGMVGAVAVAVFGKWSKKGE